MCGPQVGQRGNDLGRLQPRRVIGVEVGKHDEAGPIDHVGGGYRSTQSVELPSAELG